MTSLHLKSCGGVMKTPGNNVYNALNRIQQVSSPKPRFSYKPMKDFYYELTKSNLDFFDKTVGETLTNGTTSGGQQPQVSELIEI